MKQRFGRKVVRGQADRLAERAEAVALRVAIEGLINAKLHDALGRPDGLHRLMARRVTGVASADVRNAERRLDQALFVLFVPQGVSQRPDDHARNGKPRFQDSADA